jgi:hypothetical protein
MDEKAEKQDLDKLLTTFRNYYRTHEKKKRLYITTKTGINRVYETIRNDKGFADFMLKVKLARPSVYKLLGGEYFDNLTKKP